MTNLTKTQHELLAQILTYVLNNEERHFEESGEPDNHIYALARTAWVECMIDYAPKGE